MTDIAKPWTDAELLALPPITIEPGTTENGVTRDKLLRNPFLPDGKPTADKVRATLARRWTQLHWNKPPAPTVSHAATDPMDALLERLDDLDGLSKKLWHEAVNADGEVAGVHPIGVNPKDKDAVAAWEAGLAALTESQETILLPDKPGQPMQKRLVSDTDGKRIPKFEDSPESTTFSPWSTIRRSD